jgi:ribosomal protein S18 acetylase RimI-like enzyme
MISNRSQIKIIHYYPNKSTEYFRKLADAYFKLFNSKDNLKFLSLSNQPFDYNTISSFLKNSSQEELDYYVALSSDEEIIGIAAFEYDLIKGFKVIGIVVDNNYRLKGLGRALIDKGIDIAYEKGFKSIDMSVFVDNKAMMLLLIKMDFKPIKIETHARFDGEDLIHWKRYL